MKKIRSLSTLLVCCFVIGMITSGCNETITEPGTDVSSQNTPASQVEGDCCSETETQAACCGNCAAEQTVAAKTVEACGDCTACAEGDSSACKCAGDVAATEKSAADEADKAQEPAKK